MSEFEDADLFELGVLARNRALEHGLEPLAPERAGDADVRKRNRGIGALAHDYSPLSARRRRAPHESRMTSEHGNRRTPVSARPAIISMSDAPASRPERVEVHVDAGERRPRRLRHHAPIVEADHGDVSRDGEPHLAQGVDRAARDLIVAAKERVRRAPRGARTELCAASRPQASDHWPGRQSLGAVFSPASASALRQPISRKRTASNRSGPVIWAIVFGRERRDG